MVKGPSSATEGRTQSWPGRTLAALSPSPDWSGTASLIWVTLALAGAICAFMAWRYWNVMTIHDTDDAMRLVIVRDLVAGRGWYDQAVPRLSPPQGVWLHWSRLLDGGIAGLMIVLRQFLSPAHAEYWTRFYWPMLWVFPGVAGGLVIARNLGGRSAVFLTAVLMVVVPALFRQFVPGRIDHHDNQIVMAVIAMACATANRDRARWAIVGAAAAGLGLAIGLEALPMQGLIGASYGLALCRDRKAAAPAAAYGLTLAAVTAALFAIETPPWRWSMSFCDAIAINLVAGVAVAGVGLAVAAALSSRVSDWGRVALVAAAGLLAGGVYLGLAPQCIHGPFAAMDPAVRPFWFSRIREVQTLPQEFKTTRDAALVAAFSITFSLASAIYLVWRQRRAPGTTVLLVLVAMVLAAVTGWFAARMQDYVFWMGVPAMGAAASFLAARWLRDLMIPSFVILLLFGPITDAVALNAAFKAVGPPALKIVDSGPRCFSAKAYRALAALPPGNVLAQQDFGPFILAYTHDSVIAAPYHRMSHEILAVHQFWNAPPAQAQALLRALHPAYVVDCPPYPLVIGPKSFGTALRQGAIPPWLQRLSPPKAPLRIYRVLPPTT